MENGDAVRAKFNERLIATVEKLTTNCKKYFTDDVRTTSNTLRCCDDFKHQSQLFALLLCKFRIRVCIVVQVLGTCFVKSDLL